jgi:anti-sigma factor RsiW
MEDEPMSHQPFEDWIVGDEALTLEQRQALEAHLGDCPACAGLATSLAAVERTLGEAQTVVPEAGFGLRFAQRLEQRRVRDARRQAWGTFAAAVFAAALLATPMALRLGAEWTSPGEMLVQMLIRVYDLWVGLRVAGGFTRAVVSNLSEIVPPAWVLGFLTACLGMGAVWMAVLYRFAFRRVREGEGR